jgi:hypothetical protein
MARDQLFYIAIFPHRLDILIQGVWYLNQKAGLS